LSRLLLAQATPVVSALAFESIFTRPDLTFDSEFGQYRNCWVRDKRLVGNPLSLLLYLLSHERQFRVTQSMARTDLGLGREAFMTARRVLENTGFLVAREHRVAAGTLDSGGRAIGGWRYIEFEVVDAPFPQVGIASVSGGSAVGEAYDGFPAEAFHLAFNDASGAGFGMVPDPQTVAASGAPTTDDPVQGFPPLKENHSKENNSSSDVVVHSPEQPPRVSATRAAKDDFSLSGTSTAIDDAAAAQLAALHPELTMPVLVARLLGGGVFTAEAIRGIDLARAADEILAASKRAVWRPADYIAASLEREPFRWLRSVAAAAGTGGCAELGHRWIGPWNEACARCDEEREGWRDDRDTFPAGLRVIRQAIA
jgi:hypothetical protein